MGWGRGGRGGREGERERGGEGERERGGRGRENRGRGRENRVEGEREKGEVEALTLTHGLYCGSSTHSQLGEKGGWGDILLILQRFMHSSPKIQTQQVFFNNTVSV